MDIRVKVGFPRHHKTRRLRRLIGPDGPLALLELWCYARVNRPKGNLAGMTDEEIAEASGWPESDAKKFVEALRECRFLDRPAQLHDWSDHQGYAYHADERSRSAKAAASVRWKKVKANATRNAERNATRNATGNTPSPDPDPDPDPSPAPDPALRTAVRMALGLGDAEPPPEPDPHRGQDSSFADSEKRKAPEIPIGRREFAAQQAVERRPRRARATPEVGAPQSDPAMLAAARARERTRGMEALQNIGQRMGFAQTSAAPEEGDIEAPPREGSAS